MAVRSRLLLPDIAVQTASGEMEVVSRQALLEAMADAVILQEMAGGFISLAVQRVPTGAPNEMVTVSAMVEWKDRTDAKVQPEARAPDTASSAKFTRMAVEDDLRAELAALDVPLTEAEEEALVVEEHPVLPFEHQGDSPDGLDESTLEEEDVSAIPEHSR